jgi:hypothetical protein
MSDIGTTGYGSPIVGSATSQGGVQALNNIGVILKSMFGYITGKATTATAGSQTLPANPAGFFTVVGPDGTSGKIPYYLP